MGYKKKENKHISYFNDLKTIKIMEKDRSIFRVEFKIDPIGELIEVLRYRKKSGIVTERNIIMDTQISRWTEIYKNEGYYEV